MGTEGHESTTSGATPAAAHIRTRPRIPVAPVPPESISASTESPWRAILLGLAGVCILSIVTPYVQGYLKGTRLAAIFLPTGVFVLFLAVLGLNVVLRAIGRPLTAREILLTYTTMLVPAAIPSEGFALRVVPIIVEIFYYATWENEWAVLHHPHIPDWMVPHGRETVEWFFTGLPPGESIPWTPWVKPLSLWSLLVLSTILMMTALSVVLRKRWMDAERLQFPLAQVPIMILGDDPHPSLRSAFFRNPLVWLGATLPLVFHAINSLNAYTPVVPAVPLSGHTLGTLFPGSQMLIDPPFYRWAAVQINIYWSAIGIAYLLQSEVSLSVWVFSWFYRIEELAFEISGIGYGQYNWSPLHTFGYTLADRYQRVGAVWFFALALLWTSRREIREMACVGLGGRRAEGNTIPRWTFWAFFGGLATWIYWTHATGMWILPAILILVFFLLASIVTTRIIAATGMLWIENQALPMQNLQETLGTERIDRYTFTHVGWVDFNATADEANIMPHQLNGLKIAHQTGIRERHFLLGMSLGILLALVVSAATVLWMAYTFGARNLDEWSFSGNGHWLFDRIANFQRYHVGTRWNVIGIMTAGAGFMGLLMWLHRTFLWWPLYPLGFIIGGQGPANEVWFPFLLGWLAKLIVMRVGGSTLYNRLKATALGLMLGEFASVGIWVTADILTGTIGHVVFPVN